LINRAHAHDEAVRASRAGSPLQSANERALLNRAFVYANESARHADARSGDPYFFPPLEVAAILTDLKLDDATIGRALLHDTIEDTKATRAQIEKQFRQGHQRAGRRADQA